MSYVYKHQPSSERPAAHRLQRHHAASDPATPPALLEPDQRSFQRCPLAAYGNRRPRFAHQYSTRLDQQNRSPFLVLNEPHRGPQPRPAQALLASRSAVHNHLLKPGRYRPAVAPDSGLSGQRTEGDHHHLADRQPLDLQPHRRDPAVWHPGRMETHRQHGNAGSQNAASRMGFRPLPGEAHRSQRRLPGHEQRQDLQPGTQVQTRHTATEPTKSSPNSATAAARTPSSPATYQTTP